MKKAEIFKALRANPWHQVYAVLPDPTGGGSIVSVSRTAVRRCRATRIDNMEITSFARVQARLRATVENGVEIAKGMNGGPTEQDWKMSLFVWINRGEK